MTDTTSKDDVWPPGEVRSPEEEQQKAGIDVPDADQLQLHEINPLNANLFAENRWQSLQAPARGGSGPLQRDPGGRALLVGDQVRRHPRRRR